MTVKSFGVILVITGEFMREREFFETNKVTGIRTGPASIKSYLEKGETPETCIERWNISGSPNWHYELVPLLEQSDNRFKYGEGEILDSLKEYIASTYGQHYASGIQSVQAFDAIIAMDKQEAWRFFRNCAIKYLWRIGKKNGFLKKDLFKAMHYVVLLYANLPES